jgi:hypothetical protein
MSRRFNWHRIPALFAATVMTFGGLWTYFDARAAMFEFGLPDRIARQPATAVVSKQLPGTIVLPVLASNMLAVSPSHAPPRRLLCEQHEHMSSWGGVGGQVEAEH